MYVYSRKRDHELGKALGEGVKRGVEGGKGKGIT